MGALLDDTVGRISLRGGEAIATATRANDGTRASAWVVPALALLVCLSWGITYAMLRIGMQHSPPFFYALVRTAAGGFLIALLALIWRRPFPRGARLHATIAVSSLLNYALFYAGMNYGVTYLSAGETAMINYTGPFWIALLARIALGEPLTPRRIVGLTLGFIGVALVVAQNLSPSSEWHWPAFFAVLVAAVSWGGGSVYFVRYLQGVTLEWAVALQSLYASVPLAALWLVAEGGRLADGSAAFWGTMAFSVLMSSFLAQLAFFAMLRLRETVVVGSYVFLVPVCATISGVVLLGEPVGPLTALGGLCVVVGIILVQRRPARVEQT
jgi:drug/metabolite transporter (DMT)-like permease